MNTDTILDAIRSHGYIVTLQKVGGITEIHALGVSLTSEPHIFRCVDGDGPEEMQRCARLLAQELGIDPEVH